MDKWAAWCNSTPWGTHSPAPTPTPQSRHTGTQTRREHHPHGHPASSSAQPSVPAPATRSSGKRDHTSGPTPIPTPTPIPGNRKGTQAHAPGVSTLLPPAPSLHSHAFSVRPVLPLRSPTNTSTNKTPPPQPPQPSWQDHRGTPGIPPEREHPPSSQLAFSSAQPNVPNLNPVRHDTGSMPPRSIETPTQPHESYSLIASLINALSAAAAATAAAAAATTDMREVTNTAAVVAAIAGALTDYQATRPPPEIHRRGGRPPRKAPSRPRAHRQPRLSDAEAAPGPLPESPHRRGVQRGGWRPPRRARGWTALQSEDGR